MCVQSSIPCSIETTLVIRRVFVGVGGRALGPDVKQSSIHHTAPTSPPRSLNSQQLQCSLGRLRHEGAGACAADCSAAWRATRGRRCGWARHCTRRRLRHGDLPVLSNWSSRAPLRTTTPHLARVGKSFALALIRESLCELRDR